MGFIITYLKELNKKGQYPTMHQAMPNVFKDKMNDTDVSEWLASKLNIRLSRFFINVANWKNRNFVETRRKFFFFNWDSPHARLNSHYEAWSYKKRSTKRITGYRKSV